MATNINRADTEFGTSESVKDCTACENPKREGFRFRQFIVNDSECAMKVGTDGVLLGALCPIKKENTQTSIQPTHNGRSFQEENAYRVMDLGCGSGVVALMIAQRCSVATIMGVEIDRAAAKQAKENIECSPWKERVAIVEADARTLLINTQTHSLVSQDTESNSGEKGIFPLSDGFDLIVCNPPFYKNGQASRNTQRDMARRADTLTFSDVISTAARLLKSQGHLSVIIPYSDSQDFIYTAWMNNLQLQQNISIRTKSTKPFRRSLLTFAKQQKPTIIPQESELTLLDETSQPTTAYRALVSEFYLWA